MTFYVLDLTVRKANMLQSPSVLAPAPVFAAVMAMHALDRKLDDPLRVRGVGIIHRSCSPWLERMTNVHGFAQDILVQRRGACLFGDDAGSGKGPQQNSAQPMALADIEWTLVLHCEGVGSDEMSKNIVNKMLSMRLAGGVIGSCHARMHEGDLDDLLKTLRGGFWVDDVSHEISNAANPVHALLEPYRTSTWTIPVNLGYALLEAPVPSAQAGHPGGRAGARDGFPHAFAQSMLGLIRYTPLSAAKPTLTLDRFWRYGWVQDQFIVTNHTGFALSDACVV